MKTPLSLPSHLARIALLLVVSLSSLGAQVDLNLPPGPGPGRGGGSPLLLDGAQRFQVMDGFGVNINVASWNDGELRPALDRLIDDLGATIFRVIIDNADWEEANDDTDPDHFNWSYYETLYTSSKFEELWSTIAYLNENGIDSRLMLNFMGPVPAWMGRSRIDPGANGGRGNEEWVEMIASLVVHARITRGLKFSLLGPMNEPDWDGIEGPQVGASQYVLLLRMLAQRLEAEGLSDVRLVGPDTAVISTGVRNYMSEMMDDSALMASVDHFGFHNYAGESGDADASIKSSAYPARNYWITEVTNAWDVLTHLSHGPAAVLIWDAYDAVYNHALIRDPNNIEPGNDQGNGPPLLDYNPQTGLYTPRKAFFQNAQIFRYVKPGAVRFAATHSIPRLTIHAFYSDADASLTIVGHNDGADALTLDASLSTLNVTGPLRFYLTDNGSRNMSRGADVALSGGGFSFVAPELSYFTLTNVPDVPRPEQAKFIRGDANRDRSVDIADVVRALFVLFQGFPSPCDDALDVTDDGRIDIADPIRLLGFLFLASGEPAAPSSIEGTDPTADDLKCDQ